MHNAREIKRLLIANRGEIAVRVIRAARSLGIETVAVYSDADRGALHMRLADSAVALGGSAARETYLNREKLLSAVVQSGADAVHPGYGFLAENSAFAEAVLAAGKIFVGPLPETIHKLGDKAEARAVAVQAGAPVVPGTEPGLSVEEFRTFSEQAGYPVLVKAVAGGSGRGMRVVNSSDELADKIKEAQAEAKAGFGDDRVFIEKYIGRPRHIEVQVFGDSHGNYTHVFERECSLQRRHQKLVEEAPAPHLHPELRAKIHDAALAICRAVNYLGAGTAEFLVDGGSNAADQFYFLEMNTRIQVEHPVTEAVTGLDLVQEQLRVAAGHALSFKGAELDCNGHALEFRVYAEDVRHGFSPKTGKLKYIHRASGAGVREDSWVEAGTVLSPYYDALLSKIIIWGKDRNEALQRSRTALDEYLVEGLDTTLEFHRWLLRQPDFLERTCDVKWIDREYQGQTLPGKIVGPLVLPEDDMKGQG